MKGMLLALMVLASAAMAGDRPMNMAMAGDRAMKALLVGTWNADEGRTHTFTSDGKWLTADPKFPNEDPDDGHERWDIRGGNLIEIRAPENERPYRILFLTEHEFLARVEHHGGGYIFWWR